MEEEIKKVEDMEVPEVVTWTTPVLLIIHHPLFDENLRVTLYEVKHQKLAPGRVLDPALVNVMHLYNVPAIKYHYVYIANKMSLLPSSHRHWINELVNMAAVKLITYYEKKNDNGKATDTVKEGD